VRAEPLELMLPQVDPEVMPPDCFGSEVRPPVLCSWAERVVEESAGIARVWEALEWVDFGSQRAQNGATRPSRAAQQTAPAKCLHFLLGHWDPEEVAAAVPEEVGLVGTVGERTRKGRSRHLLAVTL
jgi:hypothetical protein